ncbi:MAG: isoamylase early set domain-containing protein [Anaerolineae bacterium]
MLNKRFFKTKDTCRVTFELPQELETELGERIHQVAVVGEFNNWSQQADLMKKARGGTWKTQLELETGREYQFRYLVNGAEWCNEWQADKYVPNNIDGDNSVVVTSL